jgi:hypothetical protein
MNRKRMRRTKMRVEDEVSVKECFDFIIAKGGVQAVVTFSGGEDSGGVDHIGIIDSNDTEICTLSEPSRCTTYDPKEMRWVTEPFKDGEAVVARLCSPVYSRYGSFAFEGHSYGQVIWDAKKRTVNMKGSESHYVYEGFSEEFGEDEI